MQATHTQTDRNELEPRNDGERKVKRAVDARQGTKPKTMVVVLVVSLAFAALAAIVLSSAFSF